MIQIQVTILHYQSGSSDKLYVGAHDTGNVPGNCMAFYGRRTGSFQTARYGRHEIGSKLDEKRRKGYRDVQQGEKILNRAQIDTIRATMADVIGVPTSEIRLVGAITDDPEPSKPQPKKADPQIDAKRAATYGDW